MSRANYYRKQIEELEGQISEAIQSLEEAKGDEYFSCKRCKQRTKVSNTTVIKKHYYVQPYSCSGGDYWSFDYYIVVCSKCHHGESIGANDDLYSFVLDHSRQFNELLDWHPNDRDPALSIEWLRTQQIAS